MSGISSFDKPIYVTRPVLPELADVLIRLREVWDSQWLTNNGHQHQLLEEKIRRLLGVPFASLFNNGTIALLVACRGLGLSGEVITTPFTFPATPHVLTWSGIEPVFCDIDSTTMNIDAEKIETHITPRTTGILAVHVFGSPCDVVKIQELADKHGLRVIYDGAHAFRTEIDDVGVANWGDITMFSFHATKLFHTAEGGALAYRDKDLKARIDLMRNFGIESEEDVVAPGINGKMNEIQAALGLTILEQIDEEMAKRKVLADAYVDALKDVDGLIYPRENTNVKDSYQYFVVRIDANVFGRSRDYVYEKLKEYNVFARKYFHPLCSEYSHYRNLPSSSPENLRTAHLVASEVLCLPFYGGLSVEDVEKICAILRSMQAGVKKDGGR